MIRVSFQVNIAGIILGGIQLLRLHLGGSENRTKCEHMWTEGEKKGLCQCERFLFFLIQYLVEKLLVSFIKIPVCQFFFLILLASLCSRISLMFFLPVRLKLIPPLQINGFAFLNTTYFEKIVMYLAEDYLFM